MGADVLRRVKTFFFFVGERPGLNSGKLAKSFTREQSTVKASLCFVISNPLNSPRIILKLLADGVTA